MERDLALEALAEIQVLEAENDVAAFRDEHLAGSPLADWPAAMDWLLSARASDSGTRTLDFRFEVTSLSIPLDVLNSQEKLREWWAAWLRENTDKLTRVPLTPGYGRAMFDVRDERDVLTETIFVEPGSSLDALNSLAKTLSKRYRWTERQAQRLILLGEVPVLPAVRVQVTQELRAGEDATLAAGAYFSEVVLRCHPQATRQDVSDSYESGRNALMQSHLLPVRERIRRTTAQRTKDQAVLGARMALGKVASWSDAMGVYLEHNPDERLSYAPARKPAKFGLFKRDVKANFKRVTGSPLILASERGELGDVEVIDDEEARDE